MNTTQDTWGCFMQYGPYYTINAAGTYLAAWTLQLDNVDANNDTILRLDVNDATTQTVIASVNLTREQFQNAFTYQSFSIPFTVTSAIAGHSFEFRVYWYGYSYVKEQTVEYTSVSTWGQTFAYDAFGNIQKSVPVGSTGFSFQAGYNSATNWLTSVPGFSVQTDLNGRITNDGTHTYVWDASNRMIQVDGIPITYDALGRMVESGFSGVYTEVVYGPLGRFALMNGQQLVKAFIPLPTGATAVYTPNGLAYYRHRDHLGSSRLATTPSRTLYSSTAYAPYGEPYSQVGTTDLSFTGQDQDTESGMHDFLMRKYSPVQGRWLSPDPAGLAAVDPSSPQTWNRYAYVMNIPMAHVDPLGLCVLGGALPCLSGGHGMPHPNSPNSAGDNGGGGVTCIMDFVETDCGMVENALSDGAAVQCPDGCSAVGSDGRPVYFFASVNGPGRYYDYSGPGSLFYSLSAAQTAGGNADFQAMVSNGVHQEWGNVTYVDANGVYSYTAPEIIGPPCGEGQSCFANQDLIAPDGTTIVGVEHSHPWVGGSDQFDVDVETLARGGYTFLDYVTGPSSNGSNWGSDPRTFVVNPNIPSACLLSGPPQFGIQSCP